MRRIADRVRPFRDTRRPVTSIPVEWPAHFDNASVRATNGSIIGNDGVWAGTPIQAIPDGAPLVKVWCTGTRRLMMLPIPPKPWITGGDVPMHDRRWLGVRSDGSVVQCFYLVRVIPNWWTVLSNVLNVALGYPAGPHWECINAGVFDASGKLIDGRAGTASGLSCATYVPTRDTIRNGYVIHLSLSDYYGHDGTIKESTFPRCGDRLVNTMPPPADLGGEALAIWLLTMEYGVRVVDRYGPQSPGGKLTVQSGVEWVGSNLSELEIPMDAFELVTS